MISILKEEWIEINGYKISNYGKVINSKGYELSNKPSKDGYVSTTINMGEDYGQVRGMHRIVATVFIPNPENLPEVNHIDGCKSNNRVDNLEWISKSGNQRHASDVLKRRVGKNHYDAKLTDEMVLEIYDKCKNTDMEYKDIANMYNMSIDTPAKIAGGHSWKYLNLTPINRKDKEIIGVNIITGEVLEYKSVRYAVKDGFSASCISGCCKGNLKTHKGYTWSYKNKHLNGVN